MIKLIGIALMVSTHAFRLVGGERFWRMLTPIGQGVVRFLTWFFGVLTFLVGWPLPWTLAIPVAVAIGVLMAVPDWIIRT